MKYIEGQDYEEAGIWNLPDGRRLPQFTDLMFKSSFTVDADKGQTLEGELEATRKRFQEGSHDPK